MLKYKINPTGFVGATERTQDAGPTELRTDRRMDRWSETNIPSSNFKLKKIAKDSNFVILHVTLNPTHLLKLLDKMLKYKINPTGTVGGTERTRDAGPTDRQTDGQMEWNQYTLQQLQI